MNEYQETYEKEISLVELMFYCLKKWRWIVAAMLAVAVAAGCYKYMSTVKGNQLRQEQALLEKENEDEDETADRDAEGLIKNPNVEYYEKLIANSEKEIERQETYMKDSVIMKLDPYHLPRGTVSFYLNIADEQAANALENLITAYGNYVGDGRLAEELYGIDEDISKAEIQYLLSFSCDGQNNYRSTSTTNFQAAQGGGVLEVQVAMPEQVIFEIGVVASSEDVCTEYLSQIEKAVTAYGNQLQSEIAEHELELLAAVQSEKADMSIRKYQSDILASYTTELGNLQTSRTALETVLEEEGETITVEEELVLANPVSAGVKFAIVGLVLGAFLMAFLLILIYLMSGRLQSTETFREEFGMQLLGEVKAPAEKKKFFGFIDTWLYHLEEGAYANISKDEQMRIAAASLKGAAAQKEGLKKIMLTGTIAKEDVAEFCGCLKEHMQDTVFSDYRQIVFDAAALEELDGYDAVVFLEKKGVSYSKLIKKERELASGRDIPVLGTVVV